MAVARLATERWMADEQADFVRELSAGAAELLAVTAGASCPVSNDLVRG